MRSLPLYLVSLLTLSCSQEAQAESTPIRILPLGDSITVGYTDAPQWTQPYAFGYRAVLYGQLNHALGQPFTFVGDSPEPWDARFGEPLVRQLDTDLRALGQDNHRGYGGWGTAMLESQIVTWLDRDQPDVVLLMAGINDIPAGSSQEPLEAEQHLRNIVGLITKHATAPRIILAEITPYRRETPAIKLYNEFIRTKLGPEFKGYPITVVDQYDALVDSKGVIDVTLFSSENHPNATGYKRIAQTWCRALVALPDDPSAADAGTEEPVDSLCE